MSREPLILLGFLGGVLFLLSGQIFWMAAVSTLGLLSAPNGLLLVAFFLGPYFFMTRPLPWCSAFLAGAVALAVVAAATVAMQGLDAAGLTQRSGEFGADGILRRLRFVTLDDPQRMLFWLLPAGILPGLALLAWPWQDRLSRILTATSVIYVLFFYVQAYRILPHHFAPAAILPIIVFWRLAPVRAAPGAALAAALGGVVVAGWIGWPQTLAPNNHSRDLGERIAIDVPIDPFRDPGSLSIFSELIAQAFPPVWTDEDLATRHVVESTATYVYARKPKPAEATDYVIQPQSVPLAAGETVIGDPVQGAVLVSRDPAAYARDLDGRDRPTSIAPAYYVPRGTIFGRGQHDKTRVIWDMARIVGLR